MSVRIQFDITDEEYALSAKYIGGVQFRHFFGRNAFLEKVNRMEGRDKDAVRERMAADGKYLQALMDGGFIKI